MAEYIDPPMPDVGMKVDFDKLLHRKLNVKQSMRAMFNVVHKDCTMSVDAAKVIPVSDLVERIKVTEPIVDLIKTRLSKKEDRQFVKDNLLESQRYISLRKSTLNMMNHNYNDIIVKKLDPVKVQEARTQMNFHLHSHLNEDGVIVDSGDEDEDDSSENRTKDIKKSSTPTK